MAGEDTQELVKLTGRFAHAYMRWLRARMGETGGGNPTQVQLLHVLNCQGPQKMHDLGRQLGVTSRNVTKLVDGLEEAGLVYRQDVPGDRRAILVSLSAAGQERERELACQGLEVVAPLFEKHLTASERAELARLVRILLAALGQNEAGW
jgi:DNA-binding MarR family transcriptional regulator